MQLLTFTVNHYSIFNTRCSTLCGGEYEDDAFKEVHRKKAH